MAKSVLHSVNEYEKKKHWLFVENITVDAVMKECEPCGKSTKQRLLLLHHNFHRQRQSVAQKNNLA